MKYFIYARKSTDEADRQLLSIEAQITELQEFAAKFGAEPWIGIRFDKREWFFISLDDAKQTMKNYNISEELARQKGLLFEELIEKN